MKKYFLKITAVVLFLGAITSCDEKQVIYDGSPVVAAFATNFGQLNVLETQNVVSSIEVNVSAISSAARVIVIDIDEENTTATPSQYNIDSATLVIPANSYSGNIIVSSDFESLPSEGSVQLTLNLTEVGDASINIDEALATYTLTIQRSCPFDASKIGVNFTAEPYVGEDAAPVYIPVMVQGTANPNLFTVNSLWGPNFVGWLAQNPAYDGLYLYSGTILINNDLTITVKGNDSWATGGNGAYNPCTNTFTYTLSNTLFTGTPFLVNVTLTPN